jgi:SP family sugar:H+ symporter-like MFS transporter
MTSIGGFLFGYDTGQISGILLFTDFKNRFGQVDTPQGRDFEPIIQSLVVSLMSIGTLIGALTAS